MQEMEDTITLEELYMYAEEIQEAEHRRNKFAAALKGIDIDEGRTDSSFEEVKRRAEATLSGKSEEEIVFDMIGIEIEDDDDD